MVLLSLVNHGDVVKTRLVDVVNRSAISNRRKKYTREAHAGILPEHVAKAAT